MIWSNTNTGMKRKNVDTRLVEEEEEEVSNLHSLLVLRCNLHWNSSSRRYKTFFITTRLGLHEQVIRWLEMWWGGFFHCVPAHWGVFEAHLLGLGYTSRGPTLIKGRHSSRSVKVFAQEPLDGLIWLYFVPCNQVSSQFCVCLLLLSFSNSSESYIYIPGRVTRDGGNRSCSVCGVCPAQGGHGRSGHSKYCSGAGSSCALDLLGLC